MRTFSLLIVLLLAPLLGRAAALTVQLSPLTGYRIGGQFEAVPGGSSLDVGSHTSFAVGLGLSRQDSPEQYELFYSRQQTAIGDARPFKLDIEYLHIGGLFEYPDEAHAFTPYVAGGIGATRLSPQAAGIDSETHWSLSLGGGVKVPVWRQVQLRFEVRGYFTWLKGESSVFCLSSNGSATCAIRAKGDGLFQAEALGGVAVGF